MRNCIVIGVLSAIMAGCGKVPYENEPERPKLEMSTFEKALFADRPAVLKTRDDEADVGKKSEEAFDNSP